MNKSVMKTLPKTAEELDRRFDAGEDLQSLGFDLSKATRPGLEGKRINIDLPADFLEALDKEAARRGITRQSLIKVWLYERLHSDSVTVLGESASEQVTSGVIRPQDWLKQRSGLRDAVLSILKSKGQALSTLMFLRFQCGQISRRACIDAPSVFRKPASSSNQPPHFCIDILQCVLSFRASIVFFYVGWRISKTKTMNVGGSRVAVAWGPRA
jgi:hypothetical protein